MKKATGNTVVCALVCIALSFIASYLLLSEWHYKEGNIGKQAFNATSLTVLTVYAIFFTGLIKNVFDDTKNRRRDGFTQSLLVAYFIVQIIISITVILSLFLFILGIG